MDGFSIPTDGWSLAQKIGTHTNFLVWSPSPEDWDPGFQQGLVIRLDREIMYVESAMRPNPNDGMVRLVVRRPVAGSQVAVHAVGTPLEFLGYAFSENNPDVVADHQPIEALYALVLEKLHEQPF